MAISLMGARKKMNHSLPSRGLHSGEEDRQGNKLWRSMHVILQKHRTRRKEGNPERVILELSFKKINRRERK